MKEFAQLTEKDDKNLLQMGYNEDDYIIKRSEKTDGNCVVEFVAPKEWEEPKEKFKYPAERAKEYKFKLDTF